MHTPGARPNRHATCPEHGGPRPCPACAPKEPPPGLFEQIRRDLEAAKTKNHQRDAAQAEREARRST